MKGDGVGMEEGKKKLVENGHIDGRDIGRNFWLVADERKLAKKIESKREWANSWQFSKEAGPKFLVMLIGNS